jgi:hypothetical protein
LRFPGPRYSVREVVGDSSSSGAGRARARGASLAFIVLALWSATAHAEPEIGPSGATRWYGYQLVAVDLAALTLFGASQHDSRQSDCIDCGGPSSRNAWRGGGRIVALTLYGAGGPSFHIAHGHWDKAGLSLGLRAAPWLIGLVMGDADSRDQVTMLGSLFAMLLDWALLAHEPRVASPTSRSANHVRLALRGRTLNAVVRF